jgi:hypothetical protein
MILYRLVEARITKMFYSMMDIVHLENETYVLQPLILCIGNVTLQDIWFMRFYRLSINSKENWERLQWVI